MNLCREGRHHGVTRVVIFHLRNGRLFPRRILQPNIDTGQSCSHDFSDSIFKKPIDRGVDIVNTYQKPTDSLKISEWQFRPSDVHLIGIGRQEWKFSDVRQNDDVLVLLINGMVFTLCGSTDPNPKMAERVALARQVSISNIVKTLAQTT